MEHIYNFFTIVCVRINTQDSTQLCIKNYANTMIFDHDIVGSLYTPT